MELLGETASAASGGTGSEALRSRYASKINTAPRAAVVGSVPMGATSQSVRNDIRRSEKSVEKVSRHTGRDDRATVEQVQYNTLMNKNE